jgi:SH3 domain-containing protein
MEMRMSKICRLSAQAAALAVFALALSVTGSIEAKAGGGRPHQNLSGPPACAALQSGTPRYRDCIAVQTPSKIKMVKMDTQLKAEPNSASKAVGILNAGTQVAMIERTANGFWCHVQSGGFSGYVPFEALN